MYCRSFSDECSILMETSYDHDVEGVNKVNALNEIAHHEMT